MRRCIAIFTLLLAAVPGGCASVRASGDTVFIVVRHAEKASDDPRDPSLSPAGLQRAQRLAELLEGTPLTAAYATEYRRTQQTAQPAVAAHGLTPAPYAASQPAAEFTGMLRQAHPRGAVLVVGHSNTVPGIVSALCGCDVDPIGDDDYGNLYRIGFDRDGRATLRHDRY